MMNVTNVKLRIKLKLITILFCETKNTTIFYLFLSLISRRKVFLDSKTRNSRTF